MTLVDRVNTEFRRTAAALSDLSPAELYRMLPAEAQECLDDEFEQSLDDADRRAAWKSLVGLSPLAHNRRYMASAWGDFLQRKDLRQRYAEDLESRLWDAPAA